MDWYRIKTSLTGLKRLATLPAEDKQACIDAYKFLQSMQAGADTSTEDETRAVADYYKVLNNMLSVFDLEKLYIPPQLDEAQGLYGNQLLVERYVLQELNLKDPARSHLLDMGCGRGRISHHFATLTGGRVSGYNIDPNQLESAAEWAAECGMSDRLKFQVGDHHKPLEYGSETFDGCFSFQAVWPFFKKHELDAHAQEMYRVLKPGARYACSEYLLTPHFDWDNEEHVALHKLFLPTLAATQSMYPADVCAALERAGFHIVLSAPSKSEAWPICEQKRDLILTGRKVVRALEAVGLLQPWVEESLDLLQKGGQAWTDAEKAKIADLNWRIVAEKR
jgi:sterol 24-C-methyltransferase